jgi:hypothetical protein
MLYSLARPLLFTLAPERAHELTLSLLKSTHKLGLMRQNIAAKPVTCMGIEFPNPVGLAAGLDKNGAYIDALAGLGFGFIEIGTHHEPYHCLYVKINDLRGRLLSQLHLAHDVVTSLMHQTTFG